MEQKNEAELAAYNTAVAKINAAQRNRVESLDFENVYFRLLTTLPSEITSLTSLKHLDLSNTSISDTSIEVLRNISGLSSLKIDGTQISNLQALLADTSVENPLARNFSFRFSKAARRDTKVAEIAVLIDPRLRYQRLVEHLTAIDSVDLTPPDDDPVAATFIFPDKGPIYSQDTHPIGEDEDQQFLQSDLRRKIRQLIETIGGSNELADLRASAEHYETQVSRDLDELRLKLLYSAANTLRTAYEADQRAEKVGHVNDQIPPKISASLRDVVETHSLFFMGFPDGTKIEHQMQSGLTGRRNLEELTLSAEVVEVLRDRTEALAPEDQASLADDLAAAKGKGPSAEIGEISLKAKLGNLFAAAGRKIYRLGKKGIGAILKHDFIALMKGSQTLIERWVNLVQGTSFGQWITFIYQLIKSS